MSNDIFIVDAPWLNAVNELPMHVKEFEVPIIKLMQHIIDGLEEKLARKTGAADEELQTRYKALYESYQDAKNEIERAKAGTEVMRNSRNRAEEQGRIISNELDTLQEKHTALVAEYEIASKELRHAKAELEGMPTLIDNKVSLALSTHTASTGELDELQAEFKALSEEHQKVACQLAQAKSKNISLNESNADLHSALSQGKALKKELEELTALQAEEIQATRDGLHDADQNYRHVLHHVDELQAFCSIVTHENTTLRGDNLYLEQIRELHNMQQVWVAQGWQAFFVAKSGMLHLEDGAPVPDRRFGVLFLLNTCTGCGHTVYFDKEGSLVMPKNAHKDYVLPQELHGDFLLAVEAMSVENMEMAIGRSTERARKVLAYADYLDIEWNTTIKHVEISKRLAEYLPEKVLIHALTSIERAKNLAPRSLSLIERMNKRFGCDYSLRNEKGKVTPQASRPKKDRKKEKQKRRRR